MDKLNLTPQERRLIAAVGIVVFAILNVWLVWPHFSDWKRIQAEREKAERTLDRYQKEVARMPTYQARLRDLENLGSSVVAEEQDVDLATTVQIQSQVSRLEITDNRDARSSNVQTNQFFDEKARQIKYRAEPENLVQFLTSLTSTNSLIRVRDLTIRPDPPNAPHRLIGDITLVASYQRTPPQGSTAPAAPPTATTPPKPEAGPARATNVSGTRTPTGAAGTSVRPTSTNSTNRIAPTPRPPSDTAKPLPKT